MGSGQVVTGGSPLKQGAAGWDGGSQARGDARTQPQREAKYRDRFSGKKKVLDKQK